MKRSEDVYKRFESVLGLDEDVFTFCNPFVQTIRTFCVLQLKRSSIWIILLNYTLWSNFDEIDRMTETQKKRDREKRERASSSKSRCCPRLKYIPMNIDYSTNPLNRFIVQYPEFITEQIKSRHYSNRVTPKPLCCCCCYCCETTIGYYSRPTIVFSFPRFLYRSLTLVSSFITLTLFFYFWLH